MKKIYFIIGSVFLVILLLLTLRYAGEMVGIIFFPTHTTVLRQLSLYQWAALGIFIFAVLHHLTRKNMKWMETFSHELTHTVVSLMFFRRVHSFHAEEGSGVVYTSGGYRFGMVPVSLAPYCLPVFSYMLLSIRGLISQQGLCIYDVLIGMSLCFHFYCFRNQTSRHQPDINQFPLFFSYLYIVTALLINFSVIWVAFFPQYNVFTSFKRYFMALWDYITFFF